MNDKLQAWLTPALLGAGLMVLLYIAGQQDALGAKVERALLQLQEHQTVLKQNGFFEPRRRR